MIADNKKPVGADSGGYDGKALKPFRLVKFFSFTGLAVILVFTMVLSWLIPNYAQKVLLERSETYALSLAENLNHQVFLQFVLPTALRYGKIALSNPKQFKRLDTIVRNNITHGLKIDSATIFDSKENIISYSTNADLVGKRDVGGLEYKKSLRGETNSILISTGSLLNLLPGAPPISCKLKTYIPFRREGPLSESTDFIMGVIEIVQDLSDDLEAIIRLQGTIIITAILIMSALFAALWFIIVKADRIIENRAEERRRLEEKLFQAERLAGLGKMVAAVSHEIKNPLGIVKSTAELLEKRLKNIAPGNEHLADIIIEETKRLDGIVMEFLDFARPPSPNPTLGSVNDIISKAVKFMEPEFGKHQIKMNINLDASLDPVEIDNNLLYRVYLNILINAVQAMPEGGVITVVTGRTNGRSAGGIFIKISDTGVGMSEEKQALIFNPFFTDKNRGTGLGLAIVKNIIEEGLHGAVEVESEEGRGTTFTIFLGVRN